MSKKVLSGKIVSNKMSKTVVVEIERLIKHPIYKRIVKRTKKVKADTNGMEMILGQTVRIEQTRPLSADKNFKVIEVLKGESAKK